MILYNCTSTTKPSKIRNKNYLYMILTFIFLINLTFSLCFCLSLLYCYVSKCLYFQKKVLCIYLPTKCGIDFYLYKTVRMFAQYLCTGIQINIWHLTELIWQTVVKFIAVEDIFYNHVCYNFQDVSAWHFLN